MRKRASFNEATGVRHQQHRRRPALLGGATRVGKFSERQWGFSVSAITGRLLAMGDAAGNDDDGLGLCAALRATALAAASPAAVEWVVTGRWPIPSAPRVEIQWAPIGTEGLGL